MLVQICIAIATLAIVASTIVFVRVLGQIRKTAAQVERTMFRLDESIPAVVRTIDEARTVLGSLNGVVSRADRIAGDFEHVGGKAAKLSTLVVDQVLAPAMQVVALVSGVRSGASFLFDGWLKRRRAVQSHTGGNNHE
jgi:uncharacterized protein YoxC